MDESYTDLYELYHLTFRYSMGFCIHLEHFSESYVKLLKSSVVDALNLFYVTCIGDANARWSQCICPGYFVSCPGFAEAVQTFRFFFFAWKFFFFVRRVLDPESAILIVELGQSAAVSLVRDMDAPSQFDKSGIASNVEPILPSHFNAEQSQTSN
jgi:hypothetical protein